MLGKVRTRIRKHAKLRVPTNLHIEQSQYSFGYKEQRKPSSSHSRPTVAPAPRPLRIFPPEFNLSKLWQRCSPAKYDATEILLYAFSRQGVNTGESGLTVPMYLWYCTLQVAPIHERAQTSNQRPPLRVWAHGRASAFSRFALALDTTNRFGICSRLFCSVLFCHSSIDSRARAVATLFRCYEKDQTLVLYPPLRYSVQYYNE